MYVGTVYICTYSKLSGYGRRRHNDRLYSTVQAFSVWYGTVYYSSGPLVPLRSADPTAGRRQYGITVYRA